MRDLLQVPVDLFYTKNHQWLAVDENVVTFGVTEYALKNLGEVVYVDLPEDGTRVAVDADFASLEGVRHIMDLFSPFNGMITEINYRLLEDPSIINDDPYGEGWIFMAELDNEKDLASLLRSSEYKSHLQSL